ncbi:hypothetical protein, partial [Pedobacter petrophilus]|uniref:hypothetical protein n=1 Tax=Pedobacter petrophilus TaxID=1908241 RepID=UPI001AE0DC2B
VTTFLKQNIIWKNFNYYLDLNTVHPEPVEGLSKNSWHFDKLNVTTRIYFLELDSLRTRGSSKTSM